MNNIIKRGLGKIHSLITKGFGKTLFVIVRKGTRGAGGSLAVPYIPYADLNKKKSILELIKTRKISVPDEKNDITVDVLLIKHTGEISVDVILKKVEGRYTEIKVYVEDEVKIYD